MSDPDATDALVKAIVKPLRDVGTLLAEGLDRVTERLVALELEVERLRDRDTGTGNGDA